MFKGLGRATKVPQIHIEIDNSGGPVQQNQRPIPLHYGDKLKIHLAEQVKEGVVIPLECQNGTGWIHNVLITDNKWSEDKIPMNLDTRPMKKAVRPSHFHIPSPQELRHEFRRADRFSVVDFNHAFPWGLYRLNTLVMATHSGSSELQERVRVMIKGMEGVAQIKDNIVIFGCGAEHDDKLGKFLARILDHRLTQRKNMC